MATRKGVAVVWLWLACVTLWSCSVTVQAQVTESPPNGCFHNMTAPSGQLEFSSYQFGSSTQCEWNITVASGDVVQLVTDEYHMGYDDADCRTNTNTTRLEVFQSSGQDGTLETVAVFCSRDQPWPLRSLTNNLVVRLTMPDSTMYSYFQFHAHYTSASAQDVTTCGEVLDTAEGEITSPGYPANYSGLLDCQWTIRVDSMLTLYLVIQDLDIPRRDTYSYLCGLDSLWIHDGQTSTSPTLGRQHCGSHHGYDAHTGEVSFHWRSAHSSSNEVLVRFVTGNGTRSGRGFRLTWIAACEKTIKDDEGFIQSPNYPNDYPSNLHCTYRFLSYKLETGYHYEINFTAFSLEPALDGTCVNDYVEILQKPRDFYPSMWHFKRYCGNTLPERLTVNNPLKIRFVSNGHVQSTGFRLEHQHRKAECGPSVLTSPSGEVTSPGYPGTFPSHIQCTQTVQVPEGNTITAIVHLVRLNYFPYSQDGQCTHIYDVHDGAVVSVYDGNSNENETLLARVCGYSFYTRSSVTFNTSKLTVVFESGANNGNFRGFSASYFVTPNRNECGQEVMTEPAGQLGLPSYTWLTGVCVWNITVSSGHRVELTIDSFSLYHVLSFDYEDCRTSDSKGRLEILQPSDQNGGLELLAVFCHHIQPWFLRSTSNSLLVKLILPQDTDSLPFNQFFAHYTTVETQGVETCGYDVTRNEGQLSSPNYPNHYGDRLECIWSITVDPGYVVELNIYDFDIEVKESHISPDKRSFTCGADSLRIYNGDSEMPPILYGPWCGRRELYSRHFRNQISLIRMRLTSNTILVKFVSDNSGNGRGFNLTWSAVCSRTVTDEEGTIESPNFPESFPNNTVCSYYFARDEPASFVITFTSFSLGEGENGTCTTDYVEINEYGGEWFSERFCWNTVPNSWTLNTPFQIRFVSNNYTAGQGFQLIYRLAGSGPPNCTQHISDEEGTIESPNFPDSYPDNTYCSYYFLHDHNVSFLITFTSFSLEVGENGTCTTDYLQIKQFGDQEYSEELCGSTVPGNRTLNTPFEIHFVTSNQTVAGGFQLTYRRLAAECGPRLLTSHPGEVTSPGYPGPYPSHIRCTQTIQVEEGNGVTLRFYHTDLSFSEMGGACLNQSEGAMLSVYDGDSAENGTLLASYCGDISSPNLLVSVTNQMTLVFESFSNHFDWSGFSASYFTNGSECAFTEMTAMEGEFGTPRYMDSLAVELCEWKITVPPDHVVQLNIDDFSSQYYYGYYSEDSYLLVLDIQSGQEETLARLGVHDTPWLIWSRSSSVAVKLVLGQYGSSAHVVFKAHYRAFRADQVHRECGGEVSGVRGEIVSPNFPASYENLQDCEWLITVDPSFVIQLALHDLDLEPDCRNDSLQIRNGNNMTAPELLSPVCGDNFFNYDYYSGSTQTVTSSANFMLVKFVTNEHETASGFNATWTTVCSTYHTITNVQGSLQSMGYPSPYPNDLDCSYEFYLEPGFRLELTFDHLDLHQAANNGSCDQDVVEIYGSNRMERLCDISQAPDTLMFHSTTHLQFRTDFDGTATGFHLTYIVKEPECGASYLQAEEGNITSPNYPGPFPQNFTCTWVIEVPQGQRIHLSFSHLYVGSYYSWYGDCESWAADEEATTFSDGAVVSVYDGGEEDSLLLGRFCGSGMDTADVISNSSVVTVTFNSRYNNDYTGFSAYFSVYGSCGGTQEGSGELETPLYPGMYMDNAVCTWVLTAHPGHVVQLTFHHFDLEHTHDCHSDFLEIRDGENEEATLHSRLCGSVTTPYEVTSTGDTMYLRFVSDNSVSRTGFVATWTSVYRNCGGSQEGSRGELQSPLYPDQYPADTECTWVLTAPPRQTVRLTFHRFDLQESFFCLQDFLVVRDGSNTTDRILDEVCGDSIPLDVTSTGNVMQVQFVSDATVSGAGFSAEWFSVCEETHMASSGTLGYSSSVYSVEKGVDTQCTYLIEHWAQDYIVHLTVDEFRVDGLPADGDCHGIYVEIRDGGIEGANLLGTVSCDTELPAVFTSSHHMMWIRYVSDGSSDSVEFQASYTTGPPTCGTVELTAPRGSFASPRFPDMYPNWMNCTWHILAEENHVIQLTFDVFSLEWAPSCVYDWVEIYDGFPPNSFIGKYCGQSVPETIVSTGNSMTVIFQSDFIITDEGFSAFYRTFDPSSDEWHQYELYPYGEDKGDHVLKRKPRAVEKIYIDTGFPVRDKMETDVFIANRGVVSFGKRYSGRHYHLKEKKSVIYAYNSDIGKPDQHGGVYYQLYTDNEAILDRASKEIQEFTEHREYSASLVLVVTWCKVSHADSPIPTEERATVQLVLVSDGRLSFGLVFYKHGEMKWSALDRPIFMGFSNGKLGEAVTNSHSNTGDAYLKMDTIKGNTGRRGMWLYTVGDSYSPEQECQDWYLRNKALRKEREAEFQRLPQCPCSLWLLWFTWGNWQWSHSRDDGRIACYQMSTVTSRLVAPYGKECCYSMDWELFGMFIEDPPHAGAATAFNPAFWSQRSSYLQEDRHAHDVCCNKTKSDRYCKKFYKLRPVGQCSAVFPFFLSWTWGDPHITTLDGKQYTFNGWGEYTLLRTTHHDFILQCRTDLAIVEDGQVKNATVFTAFGAKDNGVDVFVGLQLPERDALIIQSGDRDYTLDFKSASDEETLPADDVTIKKSNQSCVVGFLSGIQLTVSVGFKSLDISITMPTSFQNQTEGLLGNFNGVMEDDFLLPNGATLSADMTEMEIYEDFGPKWAVTADNTVLRYGPREGPANFSHPNFLPEFLENQPQDILQVAIDFCGSDSQACIYDYFATGSSAIASSSRATASKADEAERLTNNTVPVLSAIGSISGVSGTTVVFTLDANDPDGDVLTYHLINSGTGLAHVDSQTGEVTVTLDSTQPVSLSVYAEDSEKGRSAQRVLIVIVCSGCQGHGSCNETRATPTTTPNFLIAACDCLPAWTGSDCEEDYDACEEDPCDVHQNCTDLTPQQQGDSDEGFLCSGCPDGFYQDPDDDDPTRCKDVDECSGTAQCSSVCLNLPGSYACDCVDGYRLNSDGVSCDDINECADMTDGCQQECVNTEGGFLCQCFNGYTPTEKGGCEADAETGEMCSEAGCQHGCNRSTDDQGVTSAHCFCSQGYTQDPGDSRSCIDRDECQEGVCSQACTNNLGSFFCTCHAGYYMSSDRRTCIPCAPQRHGPNCRHTCECNGHEVRCDPVRGCVCQEGWTSENCEEDVDECAQTPDLCDGDKTCVNTAGSYKCLCHHGFAENDQGQCEDVDECAEQAQSPCDEREQCFNLQGSYACSCRQGYKRVGEQCEDVDECSSSQSNHCAHLCVNAPGSYSCDCHYGFRLASDRRACDLAVEDVCAGVNVSCDHNCTLDQNDQPVCICLIGFTLATDLHTCLDVDECRLGISGCSEDSECRNTEGGYLCVCPVGTVLDNEGKTCIRCPRGLYGESCSQVCDCGPEVADCDPTRGCLCKSGWTGESCDKDIDECDTAATQLACQQQNAHCHNFGGGYECRCAQGYKKDDSEVCQDVNECDESPCDQICENEPGGYRCLCHPGFSYNSGTQACEDMDECSMGVTNRCTQLCFNTMGSYRCSCQQGYGLQNDGFTCTESVVCSRTDCPTQNGGCSEEQCFCNNGYQLMGDNTCEFIDEDLCALNPCQQHCAETSDGRSFVCSCDAGFTLSQDSRTCQACLKGTFGVNCTGICSCNAHHASACDPVNGVCTCADGWAGDTCDTDIDECSSPGVTCPEHSECISTPGSFVCQCLAGFFKNPQGQCEGCAANMYGTNCAQRCDCTDHAEFCGDANGQCHCKTGWRGARCEVDDDECVINQHNCTGDHVICINQKGGYRCGCEDGYSYNEGLGCTDVDECFDPTANTCQQVCENTVGAYVCSCAAGYKGTGNDCKELPKILMILTVYTSLPSRFFVRGSSAYEALETQLSEEISIKLKKKSNVAFHIFIYGISPGSVVVDSGVAYDDSSPQALEQLSVAIASLIQGNLTLGNQTGAVSVALGGSTVQSSGSVCEVYTLIAQCQAGTECVVTEGVPSCKAIDTDDSGNLGLIIGVAVGGVLLLLVATAVVVCLYKKSAHKKSTHRTGPLLPGAAPMGTSFANTDRKRGSVQGPTPSDPSFTTLPSSRKCSWVVDM